MLARHYYCTRKRGVNYYPRCHSVLSKKQHQLYHSSSRLLLHQDNQHPVYYYLAHMNYARLKAPMEDPTMSEFRLAMDPINALAESTPGFVWSLNDSSLTRHEVPLLKKDPLLMPQLSLWTDMDSLQHFAFKSGHFMYLKRKREWFTPPPPPWAVCWWFESTCNLESTTATTMPPTEDAVPTLQQAFERLEQLRIHGPTPLAFDFKSAKEFPMPNKSTAT